MKKRREYSTPRPAAIKFFKETLLGWYDANGRSFPWRSGKLNAYEVVMAEILLQRTRAETVAAFYEGFMAKYPSWKRMAQASVEQLENDLKPIGLWRQRAQVLSALSAVISQNDELPNSREQLESLPGVGQYIANAILLIWHGKSEPLMDVNMARVLERYFGPRILADIRYDPYLQELSRLVISGNRHVEMNWAILDFGASPCRARNPLCSACPLQATCNYANNQDTKEKLQLS